MPEEKIEETANPVAEERHEGDEKTEEALKAPAATEETAKAAFDSLGGGEPSETAKVMLEIGKGKKPQIGAIAFLHTDEEEAVEGYEKALAFFKGDPYATGLILGIIDDEKRHERDLRQLFGMYASIPDEGE